MSEEVLEKAAEAGVFAAGGVGGVTDPSAGNVGNVPGGYFGVTTGPNAVNPAGAAGGGILQPQQSRQFIDYVWDATYLAQDGRKIAMRANTAEIEKLNVGERVIRAAAQADGAYENAGAEFTKIELSTKKIRLDWELSTEVLEDNIEGADLEDRIVRNMTNALANDIEDLAINGVGSGTDKFLKIMEGFVHQADAAGSGAHETVVTVANGEWTPEVLQSIIDTMPRKYRAMKSGLKFYAGTTTFNNIVRNLGTGYGAGTVTTEQRRNAYLDGGAQTIGGLKTINVLGVPVVEVPYFPDARVELTFPQNRIWGFQRDVQMLREFKNKKDTIEYTVYVRFGIAWEELDALAYADAAVDA